MTRNRIFLRDDQETELSVDYTISGGSEPSGMFGPPEDYDPGSGWEVEIEGAWLLSESDKADAAQVELTEAERERFDNEANEDPASWETDEPDWDY